MSIVQSFLLRLLPVWGEHSSPHLRMRGTLALAEAFPKPKPRAASTLLQNAMSLSMVLCLLVFFENDTDGVRSRCDNKTLHAYPNSLQTYRLSVFVHVYDFYDRRAHAAKAKLFISTRI